MAASASTKKRARVADHTTTTSAPAKRARRTRPAAAAAATTQPLPDAPVASKLNTPPTELLDVFVFGDGEAGELGLGPNLTSASRPRRNPFLSGPGAATTTTTTTTTATKEKPFDTVQVACGGMHTVALTRDNQIVTWGVNDLGALGRDTVWEGKLKTADGADGDDGSDDASDDDDSLNPRESTPTAIPTTAFPAGTRFVQVAAGDSCSFALTDTGDVWGWGAFRTPNGEVFFGGVYPAGQAPLNYKLACQRTPVRVPGLAGITQLAVGANHALALEGSGAAHSGKRPRRTARLWAWGCGDQGQLGYRLMPRHGLHDKDGKLILGVAVPRMVAFPKYRAASPASIACGEYHSFAVGADGRVWGWGLDSFGQTGADPDALRSGTDSGSVVAPTEVAALSGAGVVALAGGGQHSVALCADGRCLAWGRVDSGQLGLDFSVSRDGDADRLLSDERGHVRACLLPTEVRLDDGFDNKATAVACGTGHTLVVASATNVNTAVFGAGFNSQKQLGLGEDADDEIMVTTRLAGKALQDRRFVWAGAGGQFSMLAASRRP